MDQTTLGVAGEGGDRGSQTPPHPHHRIVKQTEISLDTSAESIWAVQQLCRKVSEISVCLRCSMVGMRWVCDHGHRLTATPNVV